MIATTTRSMRASLGTDFEQLRGLVPGAVDAFATQGLCGTEAGFVADTRVSQGNHGFMGGTLNAVPTWTIKPSDVCFHAISGGVKYSGRPPKRRK